MRAVSDDLLLSVAGASATIIGLFLVGVFFFVELGMRQPDRAALQPYMRAGARIVLVLFAMALLLPLALVALDLPWSRTTYVFLSVVLVVTNVETIIRVRALRAARVRTLLLNEIMGSIGVVLIVVLPWLRGGLRPSREDLTLAALIALVTAYGSVSAVVLTAFDVARHGAGDQGRDADSGRGRPQRRRQRHGAP